MEGQSRKPPRATRHMLQVPLRFRPAGHAEWRDGLSENISQSGVLFRSDRGVTPQTEIELLLTLGSGKNVEGAATLLCRGRVVRIEPGRVDDPRTGIAATIACRQAYFQGNDPRRI
jgi:PilZ domain-containing protein